MSVPEISPAGKLPSKTADVISENISANHARSNVVRELATKEPAIRPAVTDVFKHTVTPEIAPKVSMTEYTSVKFISNYPFTQNINQTRLEFIDLTDKLAAYFGEKEKDIKDALSDTFKKLIIKPFLMTDKIDTSMHQREHNREKQLKDGEEKQQNHEEEENKGIIKRIYYKLLELTGEILVLGRKIKAKIGNKYNKFKKFIIQLLLS